MISKEIKQLIELSGGKIIVSEGSLKASYVVMKLDKYMDELEDSNKLNGKKKKEKDGEEVLTDEGLTNGELLDRINIDIAELRSRKTEEAIENFESEAEEESANYHYESVQ